MKHFHLLILSLIIGNLTFSQTTYHTMSVNGVSREYYQYLPTGYDPQTEELPLLFVLHGIGGTAVSLTGWGFNPMADTARFILVYPQGLMNQYSQTSWNNNTLLASTAEDLAFISNLIDTMNNQQNINLARVYMTGVSMGSIMTYTCCRYMNDRIAAAVCHIGTMSTTDLTNYNPQYVVPILHKHGTADGTVPYYAPGLPSLSVVQETIDKLKVTNGFQGDSVVTTIPDNAADGISVDRIVYNCTTPLELWRMNNADHIVLIEPGNDTNSTDVTWGFLQQFTHPNPSPASISEQKAVSARFYPNPVEDQLHLINYGDFIRIEIYTVDGKMIDQSAIEQEVIDLSRLESGTYLFHFIDLDENRNIQRLIKI